MKVFFFKRFSKLAFLIIGLSFLVVSCEPDNGLDDDDPNGSSRDKIVNTWNVQENSNLYNTSNYQVNILKRTGNETQVEMENFYQLGFNYKTIASVNGLNIVIPQQTISGQLIQGSGTINFNFTRININFTADDGSGVIDTVSVVMNVN
jgi:hypothetical protein